MQERMYTARSTAEECVLDEVLIATVATRMDSASMDVSRIIHVV